MRPRIECLLELMSTEVTGRILTGQPFVLREREVDVEEVLQEHRGGLFPVLIFQVDESTVLVVPK